MWKRALAFAFLSVLSFAPYSSALFVTPTITHPDDLDGDLDGIEDALEVRIGSGERVRVLIILYEPYTQEDLGLFQRLGGEVIHTYEHATYGWSGILSRDQIPTFASRLSRRLCIISEAKRTRGDLDDSARIIRARPSVWRDHGYSGDDSTTVAILDTGVDDSHTDLSGKLRGWTDVTSENKPWGTDENSHGSHVAGIVAGTGAAIGSGPVSSLVTTDSGKLPATNGWGYFDVIKIREQGTLTLNMAFWGSGTAQLSCKDTAKVWMAYQNSNVSPFGINYIITIPGVYFPFSCNYSGLGNQPYSTLESYPYSSPWDTFNLFTGIASGAGLAGVKVLDINCSGWDFDMIEGMDWVIDNRDTFNIKVASMSVSLVNGGQSQALRDAANNVVANGIIFCLSAGNDYPNYNIGDPGLASKAITVGATNDFNQLTSYSSNGPPAFPAKPDVVAPGGSYHSTVNTGSAITSVDTNDLDAYTPGFADRNPDDYENKYGTSMACPHVSGLAALIIDAQESNGDPYNYTEQEALQIKSLIELTSYETNRPGEASSGNNPPLNRGAKDRVEGYGRICADAAIEAVTLNYIIGTGVSDTLGSFMFSKRVWARRVTLERGPSYTFDLDVPVTGDFDLYLYESNFTSSGDPLVASSSTNAGNGTDESINYSPPSAADYFLAIKWVSGQGVFSLSSFQTGTEEPGNDPLPIANLQLMQNVPNPFTETTTIPYHLPSAVGRRRTADRFSTYQLTNLSVYDASGRLVKTLVDGLKEPGTYASTWDGRDETGRAVSSGVYFYRLSTRETGGSVSGGKSAGYTFTRKMLAIK